MIEHDLLASRRSGLLLHPTSLPGPYKGGDIGIEAYKFIDFLAESGCSVWQMLPLGPTHSDGSPYQCLSVNAGNPKLISVDWLVESGWLDLSTISCEQNSDEFRSICLNIAFSVFVEKNEQQSIDEFNEFKSKHANWLDDFALYIVLRNNFQRLAWNKWPEALMNRQVTAIKNAQIKYAKQIEQIKFEQFVFFKQWNELMTYAHQKAVKLFGDMPIFVSFDSADVWANRDNFLMDKAGNCEFVAGVPPDAFSDQGQRWGNPVYDWAYLESTNFKWWIQRFATQLELFDLIRVDHFRGFDACWYIPSTEETAINGEWVSSPGDALLSVLNQSFHSLPLVAEDLGVITEEVIQLRKKFNLPGMKILQFAFDGDSRNLYLPHNHEKSSVVYTGTHDNNTTLGWYNGLDENSRAYLHQYLGVDRNEVLDMPWVLNRMALASIANLCIIPMQDILSLDASHCMNKPGTTEGNWLWRFNWGQLWPELASDLRNLNNIYDRIVPLKISSEI